MASLRSIWSASYKPDIQNGHEPARSDSDHNYHKIVLANVLLPTLGRYRLTRPYGFILPFYLNFARRTFDMGIAKDGVYDLLAERTTHAH